MDDLAKQMAFLAHRAAVNEIAEIQMRMAQRRIIGEMHGDRALPIREFYRITLSARQQVLANAPEAVARDEKMDQQRLDKLYDIVVALEATFKDYHDRSDQEWAEGFAEYLRREYGTRRRK